MRKNISEVIEAFKARKSLKRGTVSTDGTTIYSYDLAIVDRDYDGTLWFAVEDGESKTTKTHIRACKAAFPECNSFTKSH